MYVPKVGRLQINEGVQCTDTFGNGSQRTQDTSSGAGTFTVQTCRNTLPFDAQNQVFPSPFGLDIGESCWKAMSMKTIEDFSRFKLTCKKRRYNTTLLEQLVRYHSNATIMARIIVEIPTVVSYSSTVIEKATKLLRKTF